MKQFKPVETFSCFFQSNIAFRAEILSTDRITCFGRQRRGISLVSLRLLRSSYINKRLIAALGSYDDIVCGGSELGDVSFVKGVIHGQHLTDAQTFLVHVGKAATREPMVIGQHPTGPILGTYGIGAIVLAEHVTILKVHLFVCSGHSRCMITCGRR